MTEIKSLIDKCKTLIATCDDMEMMLWKNESMLSNHLYNINSILLKKKHIELAKFQKAEIAKYRKIDRLNKKKEEAERYNGWGIMYW